MKLKTLCFMAGLTALLAGGGAAPAAAQTITFENDAVGNHLPSFTSADSNLVSFSTNGAYLFVSDFTGLGGDGKGLAVQGSATLTLQFTQLMSALSVGIGNDEPSLSPGQQVRMTLFDGATQVAQTALQLNLNDALDQAVSFSGASFDRAVLEYDPTSAATSLLVDNITFRTAAPAVPEPVSLALMLPGLAALGVLRRRSRPREEA